MVLGEHETTRRLLTVLGGWYTTPQPSTAAES